MDLVHARRYNFSVLAEVDWDYGEAYPFLRDPDGTGERLIIVSPDHGRSYIVGQNDAEDRCIISKGNGLSYTQHPFLNTHEFGDETWGLLLRRDALRDFHNGQVAASMGIKTNRMHCVLELDRPIKLGAETIKPVLLQYDVECPYRISDAAFYDKSFFEEYYEKWSFPGVPESAPRHLVAAHILAWNLSTMHNAGFLHNAITVQNYTWALELLDFELSSSKEYPYDSAADRGKSALLFNREVIYTYQIVNYIAGVLSEDIDYKTIDDIFMSYGFDLSKMQVI